MLDDTSHGHSWQANALQYLWDLLQRNERLVVVTRFQDERLRDEHPRHRHECHYHKDTLKRELHTRMRTHQQFSGPLLVVHRV